MAKKSKNNVFDALEGSTIITPEELWRLWICQIVHDKDMSEKRAVAHIRRHVLKHMPDTKDSKDRWEEWLAGAYNLFAILGSILGIDPPHEIGVDLLYRKWLKAPFDYTPPPKKTSPKKVERHRTRTYSCGS